MSTRPLPSKAPFSARFLVFIPKGKYLIHHLSWCRDHRGRAADLKKGDRGRLAGVFLERKPKEENGGDQHSGRSAA